MPAILQYEFMVRALIGGVIVGTLGPVLGMFLVLRRFSLIADTLSHVALMGVAIGMATSTHPALVALAASTAGAVIIEWLSSHHRLPGDVTLAVVLYAALAVAVVVISGSDGFNVDLFGFLFGSVLSISPLDLWLLAVLGIVVVLYVTTFFSELSQSAFDPDLAKVTGVPVNWANLGLAVLTGATITLSMRVVGVLLVGAMLVVPVLAGQRLATGLRAALAVAVGFGIASALIGLTVAFYADLSAGGSIVLAAIVLLLAAQGFAVIRERIRPPEQGHDELLTTHTH
ncbi:MAG: metal ABC transporter permease [Dehalococcoidia bacterium]